jgi:hypothetical protein
LEHTKEVYGIFSEISRATEQHPGLRPARPWLYRPCIYRIC